MEILLKKNNPQINEDNNPQQNKKKTITNNQNFQQIYNQPFLHQFSNPYYPHLYYNQNFHLNNQIYQIFNPNNLNKKKIKAK